MSADLTKRPRGRPRVVDKRVPVSITLTTAERAALDAKHERGAIARIRALIDADLADGDD